MRRPVPLRDPPAPHPTLTKLPKLMPKLPAYPTKHATKLT